MEQLQVTIPKHCYNMHPRKYTDSNREKFDTWKNCNKGNSGTV